MRVCRTNRWASSAKSYFIVVLLINGARGVPTNDQCTAQIDNRISNFSPDTRKHVVVVNSVEPCPTCTVYGLLDIERDTNYPVEIQEVEGGITYSVVIIYKNALRNCHCRVRATVTGVLDLFYTTIFDNPALENCDVNSLVNIVENNADIELLGLIPAPDKTAALLKCASSVEEAVDIIGILVGNLITTKQIDLYLKGQSEGARSKFTIFVNSTGYGRVTDYKVVQPLPTDYRNWCEGSSDNVGFRNLCTCLLQTNAGLSTFVKIVNLFLPCYINTNEGFRQIVDAITCI